MKTKQLSHITQLLKQNNIGLRKLANFIKTQECYFSALTNHLPNNILSQISAFVVRDNQLILHVKSAIWISKIRFYSPLIKSILSKQLAIQITSVKIQTLNTIKNKTHAAKNRPQMSALNAENLNKMANSIKHKQLSLSLRKLADSYIKNNH